LPVRQQNLDFREGCGVGRHACRTYSTAPDLSSDVAVARSRLERHDRFVDEVIE
jgi:hypothetical protein